MLFLSSALHYDEYLSAHSQSDLLTVTIRCTRSADVIFQTQSQYNTLMQYLNAHSLVSLSRTKVPPIAIAHRPSPIAMAVCLVKCVFYALVQINTSMSVVMTIERSFNDIASHGVIAPTSLIVVGTAANDVRAHCASRGAESRRLRAARSPALGSRIRTTYRRVAPRRRV